MYVVYVLQSMTFNKHYVGVTHNLIERFKAHNYLEKKGFTIRYRPWRVIHCEFFPNKIAALKREKFLKSGVGRLWMKNNIDNY